MIGIYLVEYGSTTNKVVGVFSTLEKAKKSVEGQESENLLITRLPVDEKITQTIPNTFVFVDEMGRQDHWHWDPEEKIWRGPE